MTNPIVHFEIPADNVARAKTFYEKTFGWKIAQFGTMDYWGVLTKENGIGIDGGLLPRKNAGQPFMNYIDVDSIDTMMRTVQKNGGSIVLPKQEIAPGMGWLAAFKDPEGNIMGLHESPALVKMQLAAAAKNPAATPAAKAAPKRTVKKTAKPAKKSPKKSAAKKKK